MIKETFTDKYNKKGKVGSVVAFVDGDKLGKEQIVTNILFRGNKGTTICFKHDYGNAKHYKIIK